MFRTPMKTLISTKLVKMAAKTFLVLESAIFVRLLLFTFYVQIATPCSHLLISFDIGDIVQKTKDGKYEKRGQIRCSVKITHLGKQAYLKT